MTPSAPHSAPLTLRQSRTELHIALSSAVASRKTKGRIFCCQMESPHNLSNAELLTSLRDISLLWQHLQICRMLGEGGWYQVKGIQTEKLWIRGRWLNLRVERWGLGGLRTAEGLLLPLSNIHFSPYNCSSSGHVSMTPPPPHTITNFNLRRIKKATACWGNTGLLQVTARRVDLP